MLFCGIFLELVLSYVVADDVFVCEATGGQNGTCVALPSCPEYTALLQESTTSEVGLNIIQTYRCGFDGLNIKVCCPIKSDEKVLFKSLSESMETEDNDYVDEFPSNCGSSHVFLRSLCLYEVTFLLKAMPAYKGISRWMALLGYYDDTNVWKCGGSIITRRHVLTAAHCITSSLYVVRLGEINLDERKRFINDPQPIDIHVKRKIRHEKYHKFHNDIGLVILEKDIPFAEHITPVCLPLPTYHRRNIHNVHSGTVTGWGKTETAAVSLQLLYASVKLYDNDDCKKIYKDNVTIDERVLCAGEHKTDACEGDSGGPLVWRYCVGPDVDDDQLETFYTGRDLYFQLGIVSYGFRCDASKFKGVYTNVTHFIPWIEEKVLGKRNESSLL